MALNYTLIDEDGLKKIIPFAKDIDAAYFAPLIIDNQITYIKPLLGADWYNEIITQASTSTLTVANKLILDDYVCRILAYRVYADLILEIHYQIENAGNRIKTSPNSEPASDEAVESKKRHWENKITNLETEMKNYICDHITDYPIYGQYTTGNGPALPKLNNTKIYGL